MAFPQHDLLFFTVFSNLPLSNFEIFPPQWKHSNTRNLYHTNWQSFQSIASSSLLIFPTCSVSSANFTRGHDSSVLCIQHKQKVHLMRWILIIWYGGWRSLSGGRFANVKMIPTSLMYTFLVWLLFSFF